MKMNWRSYTFFFSDVCSVFSKLLNSVVLAASKTGHPVYVVLISIQQL